MIVAGKKAKLVIVTTGPLAGVAVGVADTVDDAVGVFEAVGDAVRVPAGIGVGVAVDEAVIVAVTNAPAVAVGTGVAITAPVPTRTSADRSVVVLSPSCPLRFQPQHYDSPTVVTPQVWANPAVRNRHMPAPKSCTGVVLWVVVASPSWPTLLAPQQ